MPERGWRPSLRLLTGVALVVLGIAEAQSMVVSLRAHARLRERAATQVRTSLRAVVPQLAGLAAPQSGGAFAVTARAASDQLGATSVEFLDLGGKIVHAEPGPGHVDHWPDAGQLARLRAGEVLAFGPGQGTRVLAYAVLPGMTPLLVLRVSVPVPEVADDLHERERLFLVQAAAVVLLLVAAAVAFIPRRQAAEEPSQGALDAYEQAMGRLRDREEEMSRAHDEERELLSRQMREREALARAGELTAGIAHEVRNGLGTIVGYARLIERDGTSAAGAAAAARSIREECDSLGGVVRHFVDYVRDERLVLASFDVQRLVTRVAAREQREGEARIEVAPAEPATVVGDEDLLERAVENVVRNARQAAGPGGQVRVRTERLPHVIRIRVSDDGPGLPAELRDGVKAFFTTKPGGLGLGLPTVQKIVRLHGGELSFAPELPRGTCVILSLPNRGSA